MDHYLPGLSAWTILENKVTNGFPNLDPQNMDIKRPLKNILGFIMFQTSQGSKYGFIMASKTRDQFIYHHFPHHFRLIFPIFRCQNGATLDHLGPHWTTSRFSPGASVEFIPSKGDMLSMLSSSWISEAISSPASVSDSSLIRWYKYIHTHTYIYIHPLVN